MLKIKPSVIARLASTQHLLMFSESDQNIITSPVMDTVFSFLAKNTQFRYSCNSAEHIYHVEKTINEIQSSGYLEATETVLECAEKVITPSYVSFIKHVINDDTVQWIENFYDVYKCTLVFIDDFLDVEIKKWLATFQGESWLLVKPFGKYPAISPIFAKNKACYCCFSERLLANQPARNWWYLNNNEQLTIPAEKREGQSIAQIVALLNITIPNELSVFDEQYKPLSTHKLNADPSCHSCGDADLFASQLSKPIILNNVIKNDYRDGGFRSVDPDITLNKLLALVDPVTGYICNSHTQKDVADDLNLIYFSSFYTQPYAKNSFKPEQFIYTTMGKGISHKQSQISALSEAVERIASQYHGNEPIVSAKQSELTGAFVAIEALTPFSDAQYARFQKELKGTDLNQVHQCEKYQDETINWTFGWSLLTDKKIYLPFNFCYVNTPFTDKFTNFFHNGGSAGNCLEEAILQGIFELIERDAVALWWYNKLDCPRVDYRSVSSSLLNQIERQLQPEYDVWVLDLTQDITVPVMCAVAQHKVTKSFVMGFGCHLDARISCQRALTELFQLIEIKDHNTSPFCFSAIPQEGYLFGHKQRSDLHVFNSNSSDLKTDIEYCVGQLEAIGVDVIVINNTRAPLALSSVKVIIPGLCHIFPYFGLDRLYQVPVKMGALKEPKCESDLNSLALLI